MIFLVIILALASLLYRSTDYSLPQRNGHSPTNSTEQSWVVTPITRTWVTKICPFPTSLGAEHLAESLKALIRAMWTITDVMMTNNRYGR